MDNNNTKNSNNENTNVEIVTSKRCHKCLAILNVEGDADTTTITTDHYNRPFCGTSCRSQYYAEIKHDIGSADWSLDWSSDWSEEY